MMIALNVNISIYEGSMAQIADYFAAGAIGVSRRCTDN